MRLRAGAVAIGALCALLALGCGGERDGSSVVAGQPIGFEELARSATSSADAESGRFSFDMTLSIPGGEEPFAFSGEGAFDAASGRTSFAVDLSSFAALLGGLFSSLAGPIAEDVPDLGDPMLWKIETVQDGSLSYVRLPALADRLPAGKTWIRADDHGVTAQGLDFSQFEQFATNDPRAILDLLRSVSSDVEQVGSERLRGVEATRYRVTVDPLDSARPASSGERKEPESLGAQLAAQSGLREVPVDVWLDESGLVRKLAISFVAAEPGSSESGEVSMTFELWDYGEDVRIDLPPASQVVDASAVRS